MIGADRGLYCDLAGRVIHIMAHLRIASQRRRYAASAPRRWAGITGGGQGEVMAIYHCSVKPISRATGRSATAAVAYRAGAVIEDTRTGVVHDYTRKQGVLATGITLPEGAPEWARDRAALWNAAEVAEKRRDARVAREIEVALPTELDAGALRQITERYARWLAKSYGVGVDWAIHAPHREGDQRNYHAHILITSRVLGAEGLGAKTRVLDAKETGSGEVERIRQAWGTACNQALERSGSVARVDHRSLAAQRQEAEAHYRDVRALGLDREPTIHLGPQVVSLEREKARRAESARRKRDAQEAREAEARAQKARLSLVPQSVTALLQENARTGGVVTHRGEAFLEILEANERLRQAVELGRAIRAERAGVLDLQTRLVDVLKERADPAVERKAHKDPERETPRVSRERVLLQVKGAGQSLLQAVAEAKRQERERLRLERERSRGQDMGR